MGYDQERFLDSFGQDLVCQICLCVLQDPLECKTCQSSFCTQCISTWKLNRNKCPNNCELSLHTSHKYLRSALESLHLKCINAELGCEKVVTLGNISKHENKKCEFRMAKCRYSNCGEIFKCGEIEAHEENCLHKIITCGECGQEINIREMDEHSCILTLSGKTNELIVQFTENKKKIEELEITLKDHASEEKNEVHVGVECANCRDSPIVGMRNICLQCKDFSLCWKCIGITHREHDFFQLATNDLHFGVTCDQCFNSPLKGIRYKCKTCEDFGKIYLDLCHNCKFESEHPHTQFYMWCPYSVVVTPKVPGKIGYFEDDILIREWEIFNFSTQEIRNVELTSISGDTCSNS